MDGRRHWILAIPFLVGAVSCPNDQPVLPGQTAEFEVAGHGTIRGRIVGLDGRPLAGILVLMHFPSVTGGISSPREETNDDGIFTLRLEHYGEGKGIPRSGLVSGYLIGLAIPPRYPSFVKDSIRVSVAFDDVEKPPPVSEATLILSI